MSTLDDWTEAVCEALELGPVDTGPVLDLARDVAHGVMRPAAPLSAYLLGLAVGRGADPGQAAHIITDLIGTWPPPPGRTAQATADHATAGKAPAGQAPANQAAEEEEVPRGESGGGEGPR